MSGSQTPGTGKVYLVGAGPGDPGLITVRGLTYLRQAQIVVYDRLVHPALLDEVSANAECIDVGKAAGHHTMPQPEINALLIAKASAGYIVVRLKGGDPFVFGRGGEECEALAAAGIPFEVVPGVSSALAVPAYAGIPVTHRAHASSFTVVTGHSCAPNSSAVDWRTLARAETLIVLMGLRRLPFIVKQLLDNGRAPDTPVAVVQWGTTAEQIVMQGTLADIVPKAATLQTPATIIVGEVVRLRRALQWFGATNGTAPGLPVEAERTQTQAALPFPALSAALAS